jgi:hypothetical protein
LRRGTIVDMVRPARRSRQYPMLGALRFVAATVISTSQRTKICQHG